MRLRGFHRAILAIALAAAATRGAFLGERPLDERESRAALRAADGGESASPFWEEGSAPGAEPIHAALTSIIFQLFGATEASARTLPFLAGTLIALTPLLFHKELGGGKAVASAVIMALSPVAVAASREAGGAALAGLGAVLVFAGIARAFEGQAGRQYLPFVGLALILMAGRSGYLQLFGLVIGLTIAWLASGKSPSLVARWRARIPLGRIWWPPVIALISVSGCGLTLRFLPDLFSAFGVWLRGWGEFGGMAAGPALAALPLYEPLLLVLGAAGVIAGFTRKDDFLLSASSWALGAILVVVLYSSRRPEDFLAAVIPLSLLAGDSLVRLVERIRPAENSAAMAGLLGILLVLFSFAAVQFSAYGHSQGPSFAALTPGTSLGLGLGAIVLAVIIVYLFGAGWSFGLASDAAAISILAVAGAISLASLWRLNIDPRGFGVGELLRPQASTLNLPLLVRTLETFSQASTGRTDSIPVDLRGGPPASLAWALRRFPRAARVSPANIEQPLVVLAREWAPTPLGADYLGQSFTIAEHWGWGGILPSDPVTWMVRREGRAFPERWLLLLRDDLASLGESTPPEGAAAP